jgi:hypothetical protein
VKARIVLEVEVDGDDLDLVQMLKLGYPGELYNYPYEVISSELIEESADAPVEPNDQAGGPGGPLEVG